MILFLFSFQIILLAGAQTTVTVQLDISLSNFTISSGKSTTFTAILMDIHKNPLVNKTINWNASIGSFSYIGGTTDSYGRVSVVYEAPIVDIQTQVNITASFAGDTYYSSTIGISTGTIAFVDSNQIEPVADAYIHRDHPNENYGGATTIAWQHSGGIPPDPYRSYLKFDISSIPNSSVITKATLYLYTVTVPVVGYWTGDSFDVFTVIHDDWTESGITWNNAPPFVETIIDRSASRIPSEAWISSDVTDFVKNEYDSGDTLVSFGIKVNGYDGIKTEANSKEAIINHPYLELSLFSAPLFEVTTHNVIIEANTYVIETCSNSSVSEFDFNKTLKRIQFKVDGTAGTIGFCNVTIPSELMSGDFSVYKDNTLLIENVDYTETYNGADYIFSITYEHSIHTIEIMATEVIPEFHFLGFILTMVIATTALALFTKKLSRKTRTNRQT
jgi:hypothetical protein